MIKSYELKSKIISISQLKALIRSLKTKGKKIVSTNGVFDILHPGHVDYLTRARALGNVLIVALNSDSSVRRLKGPSRPINSAKDRALTLTALECVDYCVIFQEADPRAILEIIKPDIHVKGDDYMPEQLIEGAVVKKNGGKIVLVPVIKGYSTSNIIKKILKKYS
jgi:rfaE bifunctional protein nucleotidyltransferase chain/domain